MASALIREGADEETQAVLADHPEIRERIARFENGESKGRPLRDAIRDLKLLEEA